MSEDMANGPAQFTFYSGGNLAPPPRPLISAELLLAVGDVRLAAADIRRGALRDFYEKILGLKYVAGESSEDALVFTYQLRRILLERSHPDPGRLGLLLRDFADALLRLRDRGIPYELIHTDSGLTRLALTRDPAGNWIHLVETRPF